MGRNKVLERKWERERERESEREREREREWKREGERKIGKERETHTLCTEKERRGQMFQQFGHPKSTPNIMLKYMVLLWLCFIIRH